MKQHVWSISHDTLNISKLSQNKNVKECPIKTGNKVSRDKSLG